MIKLTNFAVVIGNYNSLETEIQSNDVTTMIINNLEINKKANKKIWATGNLTYTITIKNPTSIKFQNITITDVLNPTLIQLVIESLRINGIQAGYGDFNYNQDTGVLNVFLPIIEANENIIINFSVTKYKSQIFKIENYASLTFDNNTITSNVVTLSALDEICKCKETRANNKHLK